MTVTTPLTHHDHAQRDSAWERAANYEKEGRPMRPGRKVVIKVAVPASNRCRRAGCKEAWPAEGATAVSYKIEQLENLLGELYQVLGALDAPEAILDQVVAVLEGGLLPHENLLPFAAQE